MRTMGIMSMILMLVVMIVPCAVIKSGMVKIEKGKVTLSDPGDSWVSKKVHGLAEHVISLLPKEGVAALTGKGEDDLLKHLNGSKGAEPADPVASQSGNGATNSNPNSDMPIIKVTSGGEGRNP